MNSGTLGAWGEEKAAEFLRQKGYRILARNYRVRTGELDLVAETEEFLVFVEVKLRKNARFAAAREFVTNKKQQKLRSAAEAWLAAFPTERQPRFDVVEIYAPNGTASERIQIYHLENAFE
ncbi:MAG: YraN family protein [Oscillospiraceae bacterium]|jgi:putative endonuclease